MTIKFKLTTQGTSNSQTIEFPLEGAEYKDNEAKADELATKLKEAAGGFLKVETSLVKTKVIGETNVSVPG